MLGLRFYKYAFAHWENMWNVQSGRYIQGYTLIPAAVDGHHALASHMSHLLSACNHTIADSIMFYFMIAYVTDVFGIMIKVILLAS